MKSTLPKKKDRNRFRKMQAQLDELGLTTCISRISKKHFVFTINGEAIKAFRSRQAINKRIEKIYKNNVDTHRRNPPLSQ